MRFMLVKTGGRKFRCIECDVPDPLKLPEVTKLLTGALELERRNGPRPIAPTPDRAALMILRRYRA